MELQKKFNVILHSEAQEFLASLDEKTRKKFFRHLTEPAYCLTRRYSRNWLIQTFGSSAHCLTRKNIEYWLFGTKKDLLIPWL